MKRLFLTLLLAAMSGGVIAEWVKVSETEDEVVYIDPTTIRKDGNLRRVWELQDLKQRDKDGEMSRRAFIEYDCKEDRLRILSLSTHSKSMALGRVIFSESGTSPWDFVPPRTISAKRLKIVCST